MSLNRNDRDKEIGADDRNRTGDLRVTSALLDQLSYIGISARYYIAMTEITGASGRQGVRMGRSATRTDANNDIDAGRLGALWQRGQRLQKNLI